MAESYGAVALVLHSHIPYVLAHDRLEEEWLFEAVAESYLPLVHGFRRLIGQGISPQVTFGLTPVLLEQLADPRFAPRFLAYLEQKSRAAGEDRRAFEVRHEGSLARLASLWETFYRYTALFFQDELKTDVIGALRQLQADGHLELITSAATHAYLPLLGLDQSVRAQVELGVTCYQRHFGTRPHGCWLPECGYRPAARWIPPVTGGIELRPAVRRAVDTLLGAAGLRYFIADTPQLTASPPHYDRQIPLRVHWVDGGENPPSAPTVAVFTRDFESTLWVWQHDNGYPGDPWYLEFHKKHAAGGLRYWRITDRRADLAYKQSYLPETAFGQVGGQATHFTQLLQERLRRYQAQTNENGIVVAAFDTELFGHWWFEGAQWLMDVIRQVTARGPITLTTCGAALHRTPPRQTVQLVESSWGDGGDHRVWLQERTHGLWRDLYQAESAMHGFGKQADGKKLDPQCRRILQQCGRELLLLQASDWPFMITNRSTPDHAAQRFTLHHENFQRLLRLAEQALAHTTIVEEDWHFLEELEHRHPLFPDLDPQVFW